MQTHELAMLANKVDQLTTQVAYLVERQKKTEELFAELTPILREVMGTATSELGKLEGKGYFAFGRELMGVADRVVTGFSPDDVQKLGEAVVGILKTVRSLTQPEVLRVMGETSEVLQRADETEPLGLLGMVRATRDVDVQKGMAVMMEVMRNVGKAAALMSASQEASPAEQRRQKLAAVTGARKKKALGTERGVAPVAARQVEAKKARAAVSPGCAVPVTGPQPVAAVIEGVGFSADGHLADPSTWTPELGAKIAAAQGVAMTEAHWSVVELARRDFLETKAAPNIRRLTQLAGLATKELYALFPKAPARTIAKIAGTPKPAGCI
jgi:TusE/DsrC/DsvC family sulfur relay protein